MDGTAAEPSAHSPIGASGMSRLIACRASLRLSTHPVAEAAGRRSSIHAATGSVAHRLAEESLAMGMDPVSAVGQHVTYDGRDIEITPEMAAAVLIYMGEVKRRSAGASWVRYETRVDLDPYWSDDEHPGVSAFGTADTLIYDAVSHKLTVMDYKNGSGVLVEAEDNPQLLYYAAGALLLVPGPVSWIELVIVQPNARSATKIRTAMVAALDVEMWVHDVLMPTVNEALGPDPDIFPGSHCRFCPAVQICPALIAKRQELAARDFEDDEGGAVVLSPGELGKVLADWELVAPHIEALREQARDIIRDKGAVPGWDLIPTRPVRSWSADPRSFGLPVKLTKRLYEPTVRPVTPATAERVLTKEEWLLVEPFVKSKSSGTKLAATDTTSDPADDFV